MRISGFQSESYQDWDEGLTSVIYTAKCNLRCPACHADSLMKSEEYANEKDILKRLDRKSRYIKRLTVTGGEPTTEKDLLEFLRKAKNMGYRIKLDSNGTNPEKLEEVKDSGIVDYVAMDIKAPKEFYKKVAGNDAMDIKDIDKSILIVSEFPDYEFRTTVVPILKQRQEYEWMTTKDADNMASWVFDITGKNSDTRYFIQRFRPVENGLIDSRLEKWNATPREIMSDIEQAIEKYFPRIEMRGME